MSDRGMIDIRIGGNLAAFCGKVRNVEIGRKDGKKHFCSYAELAEITGISASTLRSYYSSGRMPRPDATIGTTPGWTEKTIHEWMDNRPGTGARTDLKKKGNNG